MKKLSVEVDVGNVYYVLGQTEAGRYIFCVVIQFPDSRGYPVRARLMTDKEKRAIQAVEKPMSNQKIPQTDSIQELAQFWNTHDLSDFEDQLEEVKEPVFGREAVVQIRLQPRVVEAVKEVAESKG